MMNALASLSSLRVLRTKVTNDVFERPSQRMIGMLCEIRTVNPGAILTHENTMSFTVAGANLRRFHTMSSMPDCESGWWRHWPRKSEVGFSLSSIFWTPSFSYHPVISSFPNDECFGFIVMIEGLTHKSHKWCLFSRPSLSMSVIGQ